MDSKDSFTNILNYNVDERLYFLYMFNLYFIYKAREEELERTS